MSADRVRSRHALVLLASAILLLVTASFHSPADNDLARFGRELVLRSALPQSAADTCPACRLDGILSARPALALPVALPEAAEKATTPVPAAPFVAPRASVDSRPPPTA